MEKYNLWIYTVSKKAMSKIKCHQNTNRTIDILCGTKTEPYPQQHGNQHIPASELHESNTFFFLFVTFFRHPVFLL